MDLAVDKTQKEFKKAAIEFGKGEFDKEKSLELEKNHEFPKKIWEKAGELGFIGMHFPGEYSGQDLGLLENAMVMEEFCRMDSTIGSALALSSFGSEIILKNGTDEQKEKYLPEIAEGRMLSSCAFYEEGRGTELSIMGTAAVKDGDSYVINGEKKYVVNGGLANFYIVLCQTEKDAEKEKGLSLILVDAEEDGITITDSGDKLGMKMTKTAVIEFTNVKVPAANLIGKEGDGFKIAENFNVANRIIIASIATGIAQGALEKAITYAKERVQFHRPIVKFQINQHKLAEMAAKVLQARLLTHQAAWNYDNKKADAGVAAMAKMFASTYALEISSEAIQLYGGYGYITEYEVESYYRDAKVAQVFQGSRNSLKNDIAKAVIGKIK